MNGATRAEAARDDGAEDFDKVCDTTAIVIGTRGLAIHRAEAVDRVSVGRANDDLIGGGSVACQKKKKKKKSYTQRRDQKEYPESCR